MSLTPEQRAEYADDLAAGVPEAVIEEFDAALSRHMEQWQAQVLAHAKKASA